MRWHALLFVAAGLLSAPACSGPRSPEIAPGARSASAATSAASDALAKNDLDKLQGTWRIESSTWNGVKETGIALRATWIFQNDKLILVDIDGIRQEFTFKLMPDQSPKAIDFWEKGLSPAKPGIYSLEGDSFQWCLAGGNNKIRPTSFASAPGSKQSLMLLRRQKD